MDYFDTIRELGRQNFNEFVHSMESHNGMDSDLMHGLQKRHKEFLFKLKEIESKDDFDDRSESNLKNVGNHLGG